MTSQFGLSIPFIAFWVLLYIGRSDLGWKGVVFCIALWLSLAMILHFCGISPYVFIGVQAILDAFLIIVIFGGDIPLR